MNTIQKGVLALIRSAVTGEAEVLPEGFSLAEALPLIRAHQLLPLCYTGAFHCGISAQEPVMQRMFQHFCGMMLRSERQMQAVERVCTAFEKQQIDYMPLKGCLMKDRYPSRELRTMGDADILIRMEQYDRIRPVMMELGFEEIQTSDHELIWQSPDLLLELHKRLIPSYNKDYYAYFGEGWKLAARRKSHRFAMNQEDEYVYLFTHFAKHYRDGGIGCRHVLDLWVMSRWMQTPDWDYIQQELEKLNLAQFHENMRQVLEYWFEGGPEDDVTELITQFVFNSGSWGGLESHVLAMELRNQNRKHSGSMKCTAILRLIFPSVDGMKYSYPILEKRPWLLPAVWVYRWGSTLLFHQDKIGHQKKRLNLLNEEAVSAYEKSLNMVGLTFRFE